MGAKGSVLTGAAGEDYVLYRLHLEGILAAQSPSGAWAADIIVFDPKMSVGSMVQVKTRTRGADGGWHMSQKHEILVHPRLFYTFVDLEPDAPGRLRRALGDGRGRDCEVPQAWLSAPGSKGQQRKDTKFRRLVPKYGFPVSGYEPGWLEEYRERWDLLTRDPRLEETEAFGPAR